jgi:hypothetical protein
MLDAGIIIIAPVTNLSKEDIKIVKKMVDYKKVEIILIGDCQKNDLNYSLNISNNDSLDISLNVIENLLLDKGIIN